MAGHTLRGYLGTVDYKDGGALKSYFFGVFAHHSGAAFLFFSFSCPIVKALKVNTVFRQEITNSIVTKKNHSRIFGGIKNLATFASLKLKAKRGINIDILRK
jgi:hypothetical protein